MLMLSFRGLVENYLGNEMQKFMQAVINTRIMVRNSISAENWMTPHILWKYHLTGFLYQIKYAMKGQGRM